MCVCNGGETIEMWSIVKYYSYVKILTFLIDLIRNIRPMVKFLHSYLYIFFSLFFCIIIFQVNLINLRVTISIEFNICILRVKLKKCICPIKDVSLISLYLPSYSTHKIFNNHAHLTSDKGHGHCRLGPAGVDAIKLQ